MLHAWHVYNLHGIVVEAVLNYMVLWVLGSFKRYKFRLTTQRRHVTSNAEHTTESSREAFIKALIYHAMHIVKDNIHIMLTLSV